MSVYAGPTPENLVAIPAVLKARKQWVLWCWLYDAKGRPTKVPINPYDLTLASSTDALTWSTFAEAIAALPLALEEWEHQPPPGYQGGGVGYCLRPDDPYVGVDLDHCVDETTGAILPWAQTIVDRLKSYTEITPSSTGLRIFVEANLPPGHNRKGDIEMYDAARYLTLTGWHVEGTPETIEARQEPLQGLWAKLFGPQVGQQVWVLSGIDANAIITNKMKWTITALEDLPDGDVYARFAEAPGGRPLACCVLTDSSVPEPSATVSTPAMPDYLLLSKAFSAANKAKFTALYTGDTSLYGGDDSAADFAFCGMLRFWSQDATQLDRLVRGSGLMRPKWDEKRGQETYGQRTIRKILTSPSEHYIPPATLIVATRSGIPPSGSNGTAHGPPQWGTPQPLPQLNVTDLADMLDRTYPLPTWLIDKLIPEGLIFFIGSPKSSKTYLGYSLALALAYESGRGGKWLGHYTVSHPGTVVYITLEDDEADSRLRIAELAPWLKTIEPGKLLFVHGEDFPRFDQGLVDVLREQILERYHPALVVLDPISYLYSTIKRNGDLFAEVKNMLLPLRWLGRKYHCTIAGVDHRRKQTKDDIDIFETQYGSGGKQAIADAMFVIVRDDKEITVHARLRKAQDQTLTLNFNFLPNGSAVWTLNGAVDGLVGSGQYSDLRQQVLNALSGSTTPLSIQDLLAGLNIPDSRQSRAAVYQILFRAQKSQEVQKTTRNQYVWAGGN